jgi:spore coat polysaccharide biosynthesis protein SpsF
MRSKKTVLYVFEKKDVAVGQVRFDRKNKIVKLSFSICKSFRERGFGKKMVTMAIKKYRLNKKITFIGEVKPKNFSSIKIFKSLGFTMDFINKIYRFKKICV